MLVCERCGRAWAEAQVVPDTLPAGACPSCGAALSRAPEVRFARGTRAPRRPGRASATAAGARRSAVHPPPISVGAKPWREHAEGDVASILCERLTGLGA